MGTVRFTPTKAMLKKWSQLIKKAESLSEIITEEVFDDEVLDGFDSAISRMEEIKKFIEAELKK